MSFYVFAAGCGGIVYRGGQGPAHCGAEPTRVGLWYSRQGRTACLAFACDQHSRDLRELPPRDRDALNRRRDKRRAQLAGNRWAGEQEGPLARGAAAERLVERAKAWAERHPDG